MVVFLAPLRFAGGSAQGAATSIHTTALLFLREAVGGVVFGAAIGAIAYV